MNTNYLIPLSFFVFLAKIQGLHAQIPAHHMTPGLPWTVVNESELPSEALDSVTYNAIVDLVTQSDEIRYLFRVYFHPELTEIVDGKIFAELPREPGISEVVHWNQGEIDSSGLGTSNVIFYRGSGSSHPSLSSQSNFSFLHSIVLDTASSSYPEDFYSFIQFAPAAYTLFGGAAGNGVQRYGYFIQVVDSVFHPQVSSVRESLTPIQISTFPNPCKDYFTVDLPILWSQKPSVLTLIQSSSGKMVYQTKLLQGKPKIELAGEVVSNLTTGHYAVFIRREDGEGGVAYANFIKQ